MKSKLTVRRCKYCNERFQQTQPLQYLCMPPKECAWKYQKLLKDKVRAKLEKEEMKVLKDGLLTHKDWLRMLQSVFNTYIRHRDRNEPCISCGCDMSNRKGNASHYYSVKPYYGVRFHEDNVHLSCVPCNQHQHGNLTEYRIRLPLKIGLERFKHLEAIRHKECRLSIPEIKELIEVYKNKIKNTAGL